VIGGAPLVEAGAGEEPLRRRERVGGLGEGAGLRKPASRSRALAAKGSVGLVRGAADGVEVALGVEAGGDAHGAAGVSTAGGARRW
jgi:hypothetical protein